MLIHVPVVTLSLAALSALLNLWMSFRVGAVRREEKVSVGDGGNDRVIRRMRAHANFTENGWVVLGLVLAIELAVGPSLWLTAAALAFVIGRVLHPLGMDGVRSARATGTGLTMAVQLVLAIWALAIVVQAHRVPATPVVDVPIGQG